VRKVGFWALRVVERAVAHGTTGRPDRQRTRVKEIS
jgi:hypothetical protein